MSYYGKRWSIDGVTAGPITRLIQNSQYVVLFERQFASIEQIEGINWAAPTVEYIGNHEGEQGLPEGYGFDVSRIDYESGTKTYSAILKVSSQYLGDVTGYQAEITTLNETVSAQASTIQEQETKIQEQTATISEQESTIQELQEAGTAAELEAGLDAAYEEGVESVG